MSDVVASSAVHVVRHAVIASALAVLRDRSSSSLAFRSSARTIARALAYEATRDLPIEVFDVETPVATTSGHRIVDHVVVAPILRAGLGMLDAFLDVVPTASTGFVGLKRDETTLLPTEYYRNLPATIGTHFFLLDPMLATGGSVRAALDAIDTVSLKSCSLLAFIAAPEGIASVMSAHPGLRIYTASIDERLNDLGYIVPGLGDAGDRLCGTA
ncbi:MAG: uracil phosphoribosyltransferase [bacterium]|nr:uracil phosphoribosyltransferase [Candidatus Kapabacteria bacterium]